jgi:hypothetical protein
MMTVKRAPILLAYFICALSERPNESVSAQISFFLRFETISAALEEQTPVICEASFANKDGFCSVDILRVFDDGIEIIEVKSSTGVKSEHIDDMAYQYYILNSCGYKIKNISLMHINNKYERLGELDIQKLFTVKDCLAEVKTKQKNISGNIERIKKIAGAKTEPDIPVGKHCSYPYPCLYIDYCNKNTKHESNKANNEPPIINKTKIKSFLKTLSYPLYFLDFETFMDAIPPFDHTRPYQQITTQYSLFIQAKKNAEPEHREFLAEAGSDPRRAVAENLCADIPPNVCVLAYYMPFEKSRIAEFAAMFPDLSNHLMAIHNNIKDLIIPFRNKIWRSPAQNGSNSIKAVLPAMFPDDPELDYDSLHLIHNGTDAMTAFADLPNNTPEEQERIRAALLAYCRLDTYAMVKILQKLQKDSD